MNPFRPSGSGDLSPELAGRSETESAGEDVAAESRIPMWVRQLFENTPFAYCTFDKEGSFGLCTPAFLELFGLSRDECAELRFSDVTHPDDIDECRLRVEQLWAGEIPAAVLEMRHIRRNGTVFWAQSSIALLKAANGEPIGNVAFLTDITDQKEIESERIRLAVEGERARAAAAHEDVHLQDAIKELEAARENAEQSARRKSELLAVMSHEFRTPMNGVIGMTDLLLQTPLTKGQRELVETIRTSGENLLAMINDVLDFSKIEAGRIELEQEAYDLRGCIEAALSFVTPRAATKHLDVAYLIETGVPDRICGDIMRLRQILVNLLNNAVKFTESGEVVLTIEKREEDGEEKLHFAVRDTGIGIAEDRMNRLFKSFSQLDPSTARKYGGTGLGLAISKRLTDLLGGRMWAESEVGVGSTFHFTIALQPAPPATTDQATAFSGRRALIIDPHEATCEMLRRQLERLDIEAHVAHSLKQAAAVLAEGEFNVLLVEFVDPSDDPGAIEMLARAQKDRSMPIIFLHRLGNHARVPELDVAGTLTKPVKEKPLRDMVTSAFSGTYKKRSLTPRTVVKMKPVVGANALRILLAEDNPVNQKVAVRMLKKLGYDADVARTGVEALEKLAASRYDVVLMDIMMPEMDGIETTRKIIERYPENERPRIIALTANAMRGDRERCLAAGMDDYLAKPLRVDQLGEALERCARADRIDEEPAGDGAGGDGSAEVDALLPSVNLEILEQLNFMLGDGDPDFLAGLVDEFLADASELITEIRAAISGGSAPRLQHSAHTLKSSAALFGASEMSLTCEELEAIGASGSLIDAAGALSRLEAQFAAVTEDLRRQVKQKV